MINETRLHDTRTPPPVHAGSERGADDAASLETCNFAPIYLACVLASCLLAPLTVSRHRHAGPRSPHHYPLPHRHHAERALGVGKTVKYAIRPSTGVARSLPGGARLRLLHRGGTDRHPHPESV